MTENKKNVNTRKKTSNIKKKTENIESSVKEDNSSSIKAETEKKDIVKNQTKKTSGKKATKSTTNKAKSTTSKAKTTKASTSKTKSTNKTKTTSTAKKKPTTSKAKTATTTSKTKKANNITKTKEKVSTIDKDINLDDTKEIKEIIKESTILNNETLEDNHTPKEPISIEDKNIRKDTIAKVKEIKPKKRVVKQESLEDIMKRVNEVTKNKTKSNEVTSKPDKLLTRSEKNKNVLEEDKFNSILEKVNNSDIDVDIEEILTNRKNKTTKTPTTLDTLEEENKEESNIEIEEQTESEPLSLDKVEIIEEKKKCKKKNKKIAKAFIIFIYIILFSVLAFTGYKCVNWLIDNKKIDKQVKKINEIVEVEEIPNDNENVEVIEQPENNRTGQYWKYLDMKLINVDFTELKKQNSETVGWIQVNGTNINYPFVQTTNNDYYLTHAFDNTYNDAGWVFLDYRNNIRELDRNTIIYAHSRLDTSMFGTLRNVLKTDWINNPDNYIIKLSMESENTMWQVFSVYHIPNTSDYLQTNFYGNEEFLDFANMLHDRSAYNFDTSIGENDKILTLSTCYSDTEKTVLHAKLIKREVKQ